MLSITERKTCRVCGFEPLDFLYSLGNLFVSGFVYPGESGMRAPLDLVHCGRCSLVQLKHTAPQELLYARFYWYRSGVTETMRKALRDITQNIETKIHLEAGDVVLDIGSNDGTLLRTYENKKLITVGVEPASNLAEEGRKGLSFFLGDFWNIESYLKSVPKKAAVITAIGMFYDMEDPNQFIRDAASALDDNGLFVVQMMCLKNMLDLNDLGNICHEHLEFYSLEAIKFLFEKNGLIFLDIEYNNVNGGSYRITSALKSGPRRPTPVERERIERFLRDEAPLTTRQAHLDFFSRAEANKAKCVEFIRSEVARGKTVWVYGASTKGNTILQYYGLDRSLIAGASERSPEKWGKVTVGTEIPIFPEEEARRAKPDYFLVLPYAFINEFYEREKKWREGGGRFIVPLPEFRVLE